MTESQSNQAKVTLHWLNQSRSQRVVWLLEECKGLTYDVKVYKRKETGLAPPELKQVHPLGKSPVITIETATTTKPLVLAESAAIIEYLCDYFAQHLVPKRYQTGKEGQIGGETEQWLRYRFYMHYAEGSLMSLLVLALVIDNIKNAPVPFFLKPITRGIASRVETGFLNDQFKGQFSFLETQLATSPDGGQYLCGAEITAADILLSFPLIGGRSKVDAKLYPKLTAYTNLLEKNEVYVRSTKKIEEISGEPFKAAP